MKKALQRSVLFVCLVIYQGLALLSPSCCRNPVALKRGRSSIWHADNNNNNGEGGYQNGITGEGLFTAELSNITANETQPICRVVTRADSKLPTRPSFLPSELSQSPRLLNKFDAYYTAKAHRTTKNLDYLYQDQLPKSKRQGANSTETDEKVASGPEQEQELVGVLRNSLEDAGFELLSRRDIDLCDSLNVGYLLRLSIVPDVSELDESIAQEFYPERFHANGTVRNADELLFDGRVLVFWRGYAEEVTRGRLLLPKLDYLQASIVQGSAAWVKRRLDQVESAVAETVAEKTRKLRQRARRSAVRITESLPILNVGNILRNNATDEGDTETAILSRENGRFKLGRYGGSKVGFVGSPNPNNALEPFTICEMPYEFANRRPGSAFSSNATIAAAEHDMRDDINHARYTCEYDEKMATVNGDCDDDEPTRMELLERVSINNLVDLYTGTGRRKVVQTIFEKSELVEPTYEEVVVVWRPKIRENPEFLPPRWISEFADMFDVEGFEQPPPRKKVRRKGKLEIRNFEGVPMANLPAVLPKTKLVFRPADAFLFDLISFGTFLLVAGSIRLDSPRLDLLALVSVLLWIIRTVFRYSNKLARYDLLVKKFLTSKISHRNVGALRYIAGEAGAQRAIRAALVYYWLADFVNAIRSPFQRRKSRTLKRTELRQKAQDEVNNMLKTETQVQMHVERSLHDLEELRLLMFDEEDKDELVEVLDPLTGVEAIKTKWGEFFDEDNENETYPGRNSTGATNRKEQYSVLAAPGYWNRQKSGTSDGLSFSDFEERRRRFTASLANSYDHSSTAKTSYACRRGISSSASSHTTWQPAYQGLSTDSMESDRSNWYF